MKTFTGNDIPAGIRGILYLCKYDRENQTIQVTGELGFTHPGEALNAYANVPNPESQVAYGNTKMEFEGELLSLHKKLNDPDWVKKLSDYL